MSAATIIIPQHGRADLTLAAIRSIRDTDPIPWPILVVDDGSPDDSAERVAGIDDAKVTLLRQPHRGVTAAWNHAARRAETEILVFLNNDVEARGPFVAPLIAPLLEPLAPASGDWGWGEGADAPSRLHPAPHPGCDRPPLITGVRVRRETALPRQILECLPTRRFLEGWCFALRRELFDLLGGLDESLPLYWSDTDLQCRALRLASEPHTVALRAIPNLLLRHFAHRTTHALGDHHARWRTDRATFVRKWAVGSG